jgi:hypothetical protein
MDVTVHIPDAMGKRLAKDIGEIRGDPQLLHLHANRGPAGRQAYGRTRHLKQRWTRDLSIATIAVGDHP